MSLSARSPNPWFILFYHHPNGQKPKFYIRHIWQNEIYYILKRVRAEHQNRAPLHKRFVEFSFGNPFPIDTTIIEYIHNTLQYFGETYSEKKKEIRSTVGYETGYAIANFTVSATNSDSLNKNLMGYGEGLKFQNFNLYDTRFGYVGDIPDISFESGNVYIEPLPIEGFEIFITGESRRKKVTLEASAFCSPLSDEETNDLRFRLSASPLDIFFRTGGNGEMKIDLPLEQKFDLYHLSNICQICSIISNERSDVQIWKNGQRLLGTFLQQQPSPLNFDWTIAEGVTDTLLSHLTRRQSGISVLSLEEMLKWQREILIFHHTYKNSRLMVEFDAQVNDIGIDSEIFEVTDAVYYVSLSINSLRFNNVVRRSVFNISQNGGRVRVELGDPEVYFSYADNPDNTYSNMHTNIKKDYERVLNEIKKHAKGTRDW